MRRKHHDALSVAEIESVFARLDADHDGVLVADELRQGLRELNIPATDTEVQHLMQMIRSASPTPRSKEPDAPLSTTTATASDVTTHNHNHSHNSNGSITIREFTAFLQAREAQLQAVFNSMDLNHNGRLDANELSEALEQLNLDASPKTVARMIKRIDKNNDGSIDYKEFRAMALLLPSAEIMSIVDVWQSQIDFIDIGETSYTVAPPADHLSWRVLLAGGVAGAVSRTATAPMDRLKTLLQAGGAVGRTGQQPQGIVNGLRLIYVEGGWTAFFRGNGANVAKIIPETAVKFYAYEQIRSLISPDSHGTNMAERFVAGALAGVVSQTSIYPMEVCKTRLAIAPTGTYRGITDCFAKILRHETPATLFRGITPSLIGIVPYAGVDLSVFFTLKEAWKARHPGQEPTVLTHLTCGAISSFCGQVVAYPLQLVRTRLQAQGLPGRPIEYSGMIDCFSKVVRHDGPLGLFRGLAPNFLKAVPAISLSYAVYEQMRVWLGI